MSDTRIPYCGECCFHGAECMDGFGYCKLKGHSTHCGDECWLDHTRMQPTEIVIGLHYIQKWRRGAKIEMPSPYVIGKVLDACIRKMRKIK